MVDLTCIEETRVWDSFIGVGVRGQSFRQRAGMLSADTDISLKRRGLLSLYTGSLQFPSTTEPSSSAGTGENSGAISWMGVRSTDLECCHLNGCLGTTCRMWDFVVRWW